MCDWTTQTKTSSRDGHNPVPHDAKDRITTIRITKVAKVDTPWIAFDDDVVTPDYVEKFEKSLLRNPDVIIFLYEPYSNFKVVSYLFINFSSWTVVPFSKGDEITPKVH